MEGIPLIRRIIKNPDHKPIYIYNKIHNAMFIYFVHGVLVIGHETVLTENEAKTYLLSDPTMEIIECREKNDHLLEIFEEYIY